MMTAGDHHVIRDCHVEGMVGGNLVVRPGVTATVSAMVNGDLVLSDRAVVKLDGMVNGDVFLNGGTLSGAGLINGRTRDV